MRSAEDDMVVVAERIPDAELTYVILELCVCGVCGRKYVRITKVPK